ncbi:hypothetical protein WISP_04686 [Willisornis vidua]|uniref:Uncharacterized protein n=1 Tax=Willisornis vidua TaxID=1566151 RepID=A0ABQ9DYX5_9PASS|nr:hypothetical protein WISP_04686 [Willisornis vidua]
MWRKQMPFSTMWNNSLRMTASEKPKHSVPSNPASKMNAHFAGLLYTGLKRQLLLSDDSLECKVMLILVLTLHWNQTHLQTVMAREHAAALFVDWGDIRQPPIIWDLPRDPGLLEDDGEWLGKLFCQLPHHPGLDPIWSHRLVRIQLAQSVKRPSVEIAAGTLTPSSDEQLCDGSQAITENWQAFIPAQTLEPPGPTIVIQPIDSRTSEEPHEARGKAKVSIHELIAPWPPHRNIGSFTVEESTVVLL